jgi:hypothetical protein
VERALVAMLPVTTNGTRPQPSFGTLRDDEAVRTESNSADKGHGRPENENERLESESERRESVHDRNAPGDQDGDNGCI